MKITRRQLRKIIKEAIGAESEKNPNAYNERATAQELIEALGKDVEKFPGFDGLSVFGLKTDGPGYGTPYKSFRLRINLTSESEIFEDLMDEGYVKDQFDYIINDKNMKKPRPIKKYTTHIEQYGGTNFNDFFYIYSLTVPGLHPNEDY